MHRGCAEVTTAARYSRRCASREPHGPADRYWPLLSSQALPAFCNRHQLPVGCRRKIDRTATERTMARTEQARVPGIGAGVSGAPAAFLGEVPHAVSSARWLPRLRISDSSVMTVKRARAAGPNVVDTATSAASRPRAMTSGLSAGDCDAHQTCTSDRPEKPRTTR